MEAINATFKMFKLEANFEENILNDGSGITFPLINAYEEINNGYKYSGMQMSLDPPILEDETKIKHENVDIELDPPKLELVDIKFEIDEGISGKLSQLSVFGDSNNIAHNISKELCVKLFKQPLMPKQLRIPLQKLENIFPRPTAQHKLKRHGIRHKALRKSLAYGEKRDYRSKYKDSRLRRKLEHKTFSCCMCPFKAKNYACYYSHMTVHNKKYETCPECQKVIDIRFLRIHLLTHSASIDDKLKCPKCSYTSLYPSNMYRHKKIHKSDEDQKCKHCPECSYMTTESGNLKRHYTAMHSPESNYACKMCDFTSKHKSSWQQHINTQHVHFSQRKKHECSLCSSVFLTNRGLRLHITVQHKDPNEVTNFKCMHCAYSTVVKQTLQKHIKARHCFKFQTKFRCLSCKFEVDEESNMEDHMQQHHQNVSEECQYEVWEVLRAGLKKEEKK